VSFQPTNKHTIHFRPGTQDKGALQETLLENCYRLPDRLDSFVVIDVGAHCGYFALACLARGAKHVICVEPDAGNCEMLKRNLADYAGRVTIHERFAAWRSDEPERQVLHLVKPSPGHTCMGTVLGGQGDPVSVMAMDDLIEAAGNCAGAAFVLLKLDCEGSEYGCVYTSELLERCDVVLGESHQLGTDCVLDLKDGTAWPMDHAGMVCFLADKGYRVRTLPNSPAKSGLNVLFWASLRDTPYFSELHPQPASPDPEPGTPTGEGLSRSRNHPDEGAPGDASEAGSRAPLLMVP
jgi:FkbM family methyltransferase